MGVDVLLDAVFDGEYDPECARIETALRAVWLLYCREKWSLLGPMGVEKKLFETVFSTFADDYVGWRMDGSPQRIRSDRQTIEFLGFLRRFDIRLAIRVLSAAIWLVGQYMTARRRIMAAWYPDDYWGEGDN